MRSIGDLRSGLPSATSSQYALDISIRQDASGGVRSIPAMRENESNSTQPSGMGPLRPCFAHPSACHISASLSVGGSSGRASPNREMRFSSWPSGVASSQPTCPANAIRRERHREKGFARDRHPRQSQWQVETVVPWAAPCPQGPLSKRAEPCRPSLCFPSHAPP